VGVLTRIELSSKKLNSGFIKKITEVSGQNVYQCYQCGKCSAGCPMASAMDILPNQVIRLAQLGLEEDIVSSKTIWLCASCLTCDARCPKGVDLSKIMEAMRLLTLRKNKNHIDLSKLPPKTIAEMPQIALVSSFRKLTS
jgi:heterodisulfide reductase subunit C2